jgi:tRNA pseudouridine38-40 synthase
MAHYKVILAYDGSDFKGYQRQGDARTVQGVFETALRLIGWQAGRFYRLAGPDTGVNATGQVVAFDFVWEHTTPELLRALNANLPNDVAVRALEEVPPTSTPGLLKARQYCYRLFCDEIATRCMRRYAWRVWPAVFRKI